MIVWFDRIADEPCTGQGTLSLAQVEGRGAPRFRLSVFGVKPR
jgi:hypothetical protein